jgi:hypothetical protein
MVYQSLNLGKGSSSFSSPLSGCGLVWLGSGDVIITPALLFAIEMS